MHFKYHITQIQNCIPEKHINICTYYLTKALLQLYIRHVNHVNNLQHLKELKFAVIHYRFRKHAYQQHYNACNASIKYHSEELTFKMQWIDNVMSD